MLALALTALAGAPVAIQAEADEPARDLARAEGELDNDAYLSTHDGAAAALERGDLACAALSARGGAPADAREWTEVFEAWRAALAASATGDAVPPRAKGAHPWPWPDRDGTASAALDRRRDGVEAAVHLRLRALDAGVRASWRRRFEGLAAAEVEAARTDAARLAGAARGFPATAAAVRAQIACAESEFESGRPVLAAGWLERARADLALLDGAEPALEAALSARSALFAESDESAEDASAPRERWEFARSLAPLGELLVEERNRVPRALLAPGVGVRPGLAFLDAARALIHVPGGAEGERLALIELAEVRRVAVIDLAPLLGERGITVGPVYAPAEPPGWPLAPASDGTNVVLVSGRRARGLGNALVCLTIEPGTALGAPPAPSVRWALASGLRTVPALGSAPVPDGLGLDSAEFQPGPRILDGQVVVAVREYAGEADSGDPRDSAVPSGSDEIRTSLVGLDLATGALRWRTPLGRGLELRRDRARFSGPAFGAASAQPLAVVGQRVFAGTSTGFGALVDALDGRVDWLLANRRRPGDARTWSGGWPSQPGDGECLLWAPADGDFLYWLRPAPDRDGRGVFLHSPWAAGSSEVALSGDSAGAVVLARDGSERAACAWDEASGARTLTPYLGPDETFSGEGLASRERAYFATTRGVYLLDRTQGLFVLDYTGLKPLGVPGGSVYAQGDRVCVLGTTTLWVFVARP